MGTNDDAFGVVVVADDDDLKMPAMIEDHTRKDPQSCTRSKRERHERQILYI